MKTTIIKPIFTFIIGSRAFFNKIKDYSCGDIDELNIMNEFPFKTNVIHGHMKGKDVFFYRNMNKNDFIEDAINSGEPLRAGKFLVPEFANYLKLTISDIKKLGELFDKIDDNHKYEKIIFDSYIINNGFYLTDTQLNKAYNKYIETRK